MLTGDVAALYVNIHALQVSLTVGRENIQFQQESADLTEMAYRTDWGDLMQNTNQRQPEQAAIS